MNIHTTPPDNPDKPDNLQELRAFKLDLKARKKLDDFMRDHGNPQPLIPREAIIGELEIIPVNMANVKRRGELSTTRRENMRRELKAFNKAVEGLSLDTMENLYMHVMWEGVHNGEEWTARFLSLRESASLVLGWLEEPTKKTRGKSRLETPGHTLFIHAAASCFVAAGFDRLTIADNSPFRLWLEVLKQILPIEIMLTDYVSIIQREIGHLEKDRFAYVEKEKVCFEKMRVKYWPDFMQPLKP
jgi:hypothetical protein